MSRIAYADTTAPEVAELAASIAAQRGSILDLYKMLLHAPPVAAGWLEFLTAIRQKCTLSGALREIVIIRIALLNRASYEAEQHVPYALKEGVSPAQIEALGNWENSGLFSGREQAVLAYADAMTKNIQVPPAIFAAIRAAFSEREIVELTATIAAYNMVSRFLEALEIHAMAQRKQAG